MFVNIIILNKWNIKTINNLLLLHLHKIVAIDEKNSSYYFKIKKETLSQCNTYTSVYFI